MSKNITVNVTALEKIKSEALTPKIKGEIENLIKTRDALNTIIEKVEDRFEKAMDKDNTKLIEWGNLKITRVVSGRKFAFNPKQSVDKKFVKEVRYFNINSEAVEKYMEKKGEPPQGVVQKGRPIKVKIEIE